MPGGRPTKFTKENKKIILRMIKAGNPMSVSARAVGMHPDTFRRWNERVVEPCDEEPKGNEYFRFFQELEKMKALYKAECLKKAQATETKKTKKIYRKPKNVMGPNGEIYPEYFFDAKDKRKDGTILVEVVEEKSVSKPWQSGMTQLERRDPEHWAKREYVEEVPVPKAIKIEDEFDGDEEDVAN